MGFKINVNGEQVWESEGDPILVKDISIQNQYGEVSSYGSPALDDTLNINVVVRDPNAMDLDLVEWRTLRDRAASAEETAAANREAAPTITEGVDLEVPEPATKEDQAKEADAIGDIEV